MSKYYEIKMELKKPVICSILIAFYCYGFKIKLILILYKPLNKCKYNPTSSI